MRSLPSSNHPIRHWLILVLSVAPALALAAQFPMPQDETAIRNVLAEQVEAWNNGDVVTFMNGYEDSPETTFVSDSVVKGYALVLERYKARYPTPEKMGKLQFAELEVRMLGLAHASVIGRFHLDRDAAGGGPATGIFTLTFRKAGGAWRIILDHTSQTAPKGPE